MRDLQRWIDDAAPGAQLPSSRSLVAEYGASPVTVQKALHALSARGVVETRPGVGAFVRARRAARPADYGWQTGALSALPGVPGRVAAPLRSPGDDTIALHSGYPDRSLLPERLVRSAFTRAARTDAVVHRASVGGLPELRAWFAAELGGPESPGGGPVAADTVIVPGSQSGLSVLLRSLVGRGNTLLIESPSYWGAIIAAADAGIRLHPVPTGPDGPDPEELDRAFAETGARAFYAQPTFANPTGACWPAATRERVLDLARRHGAFVIEDDWARDFAIDDDVAPLAVADDDGHVVYLRSLTKSVSPAVRVAGIVARGPARERVLGAVATDALYVSPILQAVALDVVTQPGWRTHLRGLREQLRVRRDLLAGALAAHAPAAHLDAIPAGGLNLWARLPDHVDPHATVRACEHAGVLLAAGDAWFPAEPAGPYLRLNYAGPGPDRFDEAARVLGGVLDGGR